jgi:hypothetical protein
MEDLLDFCDEYVANKDFEVFSTNIKGLITWLVDLLSDEWFTDQPNQRSDYIQSMFDKCQQPMGKYINSLNYLEFKNNMNPIYEEIKNEFLYYARYMRDQRMMED